MSAHTPKPWTIREDWSGEWHIAIDAGDGVGAILIERCVAGHDQHDMPNALLVCAAPDLLAALKITSLDEHPPDEQGECLCSQCAFRRAARAAIAKAEGRES